MNIYDFKELDKAMVKGIGEKAYSEINITDNHHITAQTPIYEYTSSTCAMS
jgi:hypothetical protein